MTRLSMNEISLMNEVNQTGPTKRIIGKILVNQSLAIQSMGFAHYLPLGKPHIIAAYLESWGVDEIVMVDRQASRRGEAISARLVREVVDSCQTPLTVGGGIHRAQQAMALVEAGADRIVMNSAAIDQPSCVAELVQLLGQQSVVVMMDVVCVAGNYVVYDYRAAAPTNMSALTHCQQMQRLGVGEVVVQVVERDGCGNGFETALYEQLRQHLHIGLIASSGYGQPSHIHEVFKTGVEGVALGNALHYREHSVSQIKAALRSAAEGSAIDGRVRQCAWLNKQLVE